MGCGMGWGGFSGVGWVGWGRVGNFWSNYDIDF